MPSNFEKKKDPVLSLLSCPVPVKSVITVQAHVCFELSGAISDPEAARARREKRQRRKMKRQMGHEMYSVIYGVDAPMPPSNHSPRPHLIPTAGLGRGNSLASSTASSSLWNAQGKAYTSSVQCRQLRIFCHRFLEFINAQQFWCTKLGEDMS